MRKNLMNGPWRNKGKSYRFFNVFEIIGDGVLHLIVDRALKCLKLRSNLYDL